MYNLSDMRYFVPVLILSMLSFTFVSTSYAFVPAPSSDPTLPQISLVIILRDSNGNLVNYLEPSVIFIRDAAAVHELINTSNYTTITRDGHTMKVYISHYSEGFDHKGQYTQYGLWYKNDFILVLNNNGYIGQPGDTIDIYWKILSTR